MTWYGKGTSIKYPMVARSLGTKKDNYCPIEENEEVLGPEVPYLSVVGALMYLV